MKDKHSGFGISSLIISTTIGILMFLLFIVAGIMEASTVGGIDEDSVGAILLGLTMMAFIFLDVVAIGLGIAGFFQKDRKKISAIIGVFFGASTIVITVFLVILGLVFEAG